MRRLLWLVPVLLLSPVIFGWAAADNSQDTGSIMVLQAESTAPPAGGLEKKPDQPEEYDVNYSYDPAGRRDPFTSLLGGIKKPGGDVPRGALSVADAKVVGITQSAAGGFVALIMGSDRKTRFMKVGDKLFDGEIIGIEADRVIFRQDITDELPTAPGLRSKEVVKRLHPVQEGT